MWFGFTSSMNFFRMITIPLGSWFWDQKQVFGFLIAETSETLARVSWQAFVMTSKNKKERGKNNVGRAWYDARIGPTHEHFTFRDPMIVNDPLHFPYLNDLKKRTFCFATIFLWFATIFSNSPLGLDYPKNLPRFFFFVSVSLRLSPWRCFWCCRDGCHNGLTQRADSCVPLLDTALFIRYLPCPWQIQWAIG